MKDIGSLANALRKAGFSGKLMVGNTVFPLHGYALQFGAAAYDLS